MATGQRLRPVELDQDARAAASAAGCRPTSWRPSQVAPGAGDLCLSARGVLEPRQLDDAAGRRLTYCVAVR
jgi:hypothetical protein